MLGFSRKNKDSVVEITVSNRTILRIVALVIASFLFLAAVKTARHALILIFVAIFLAVALNAPVHWLGQRIPGKRRGSRTLATAISFFVVIALLIGFIASIVPPLVRQTSNFISDAPGLVEGLKSDDTSLGRTVRKYNMQDRVDEFSGQLSDRLQGLSGSAFSAVTRITSSIFSTLAVLALTFMMLTEGPKWVTLIRRLLPQHQEKHADELSQEMYKVIRGYVNGQVLLAAIASLLVVVPLFILHVSYPIALMVIVFICGLIPMVGHTIGAVIVTAVAAFHSPAAAIIILAWYILYQQIENYVIQPRIQANSTDMSPLLVFASVLIGVSFSGLLGGLVAIPLAGCLRILVLDYLARHELLTPLEELEQHAP